MRGQEGYIYYIWRGGVFEKIEEVGGEAGVGQTAVRGRE